MPKGYARWEDMTQEQQLKAKEALPGWQPNDFNGFLFWIGSTGLPTGETIRKQQIAWQQSAKPTTGAENEFE